jgi:uroporphyrinogen III methyltransferase/synthase
MSLQGKRVLVTRSRKQAGALSGALQQAGAIAVELPVIAMAPPEDAGPFRSAVSAVERFDWLVLTSANGVEALFDELERQAREPAACLAGVRVAAIGPTTAKALRDRGIEVEVVPEEYRGEAVAAAIIGRHDGRMNGVSVLLARAAGARDALPGLLRQAGASVEVVEAYRALPPDPEVLSRLKEILERGEVHAITFTSSSTVRHTVQALGKDSSRLLHGLIVASIGPVTTETAEQHGLSVDVTASEYTIEGLVRALSEYYREQE